MFSSVRLYLQLFVGGLTSYLRYSGADPGFQVRGRTLKNRNFVGVFRVKNHDFTQILFFFSNFKGRAPGTPSLDPPLLFVFVHV